MELVTVTKADQTFLRHIWVTIDAMSKPWEGAFNVPAAVAFTVGDRCQIETLDGRRATIVVESASSFQGKHLVEPLHKFPRLQTRVTFVGEGSLPL